MEKLKLLTGNEAIAWGVKLSRPKVISSFPITPNTRILQVLSRFIADGELDAQFVATDGDYSMAAIGVGSGQIGVRTFLSTAGVGLSYLYENLSLIPWLRLPIVMSVTNRANATGGTIGTDYSDSMSARDLGWIQYYCGSAQEALDTVIQAFKVSEDPRVSMPAMVCISGIDPERYLSHTSVPVKIPEQRWVNEYLPPYRRTTFPHFPSAGQQMRWELVQAEALELAKPLIVQADQEYSKLFGRSYGGFFEAYRCEDAEAAIMTMGAMAMTAKEAVDALREQGMSIGLIRLRVFRPFPKAELALIAKDLKALAVVDRCLSKGVKEGALFTDLKSTFYHLDERPHLLGFVAGLHGVGVTKENFMQIGRKAFAAKTNHTAEMILPQEAFETPTPEVSVHTPSKVFYSGYRGCAGCAMSLAYRHIMEALGEDIALVPNSGCGTPFIVPPNIARVSSSLPSGGAVATGVTRALKATGDHETTAVLLGGDGALGDIGMGPLSGAMERQEDILCICLDNEAHNTTGFSRSGSTPHRARTPITEVGDAQRGKLSTKKNLPLIVAAHGATYVATASISNIPDLIKKVKDAKRQRGFRYIQVLTPCHYGWGFPLDRIIEVSRLAVESRVWPLYTIANHSLQITYRPHTRTPVIQYINIQERFKHLSLQEINMFQESVDKAWKQLEIFEHAYY